MRPSVCANSSLYEEAIHQEHGAQQDCTPIDCLGTLYHRFCCVLANRDELLVELIMREAGYSAPKHIRRKMLRTLLSQAVRRCCET